MSMSMYLLNVESSSRHRRIQWTFAVAKRLRQHKFFSRHTSSSSLLPTDRAAFERSQRAPCAPAHADNVEYCVTATSHAVSAPVKPLSSGAGDAQVLCAVGQGCVGLQPSSPEPTSEPNEPAPEPATQPVPQPAISLRRRRRQCKQRGLATPNRRPPPTARQALSEAPASRRRCRASTGRDGLRRRGAQRDARHVLR